MENEFHAYSLIDWKTFSRSCPMFNEKARKVYGEYLSKLDGLLKKYGIKELGAGTVAGEHLSVAIFEAPSLEVFQKCFMEPEVLAVNAYETYEIKAALGTGSSRNATTSQMILHLNQKPKTLLFYLLN